MNICAFLLVLHHFILCIKSPVSGFLLLYSCPDFQDWRQTSQQNQSEWLIGRSEESPDYQIIKPDFTVLANCDATVSRYEYVSNGQNQTFVTQTGTAPKLYEDRSPQRFTENGDYFDGFHYFQRSEYCVNSITDSAIELRVCQPICTAFNTRSKTRYCVPKCCAPDEVLGYWSLRCLRYRQHEPTWKPVICKDELCGQMDPFENIHYQRHSLTCTTRVISHPMTTVELVYKDIHEVDEKQNIRMDITQGHLELQQLSIARKWVRYSVDFCVDGFVKSGRDSYSGSIENQVFLTCIDQEPVEKEEDEASYYTQGWISVSMQLMGALLTFLTAIIYLILLDRQNFNGLLILSYSISSGFAHLFFAAAHYISIYPSPEITGIFDRGPVCMAIAISSHFFVFVGYSWLTVMNFYLWLTMRSMTPVNARNSKRLKSFIACSILAWGIPGVVVASFVVVDVVYRDPLTYVVVPDYAVYSCTVATWSRAYYTYIPIAIFLAVNGILTFLTVLVMLKAKRSAAQMTKTGADTYTTKLFLKLFILMGLIAFVNIFLWWFNGKEEPRFVRVLKFIMQFESIPTFFILCCNEKIARQLEEKFPSLNRISSVFKAMQLPSFQSRAFCNNRSHDKTSNGRTGGTEFSLQDM